MSQSNRPIRPADFATPIQYWRGFSGNIGLLLVLLGLICVIGLGALFASNHFHMATSKAQTPAPKIVPGVEQSTVLLVRTDNSGQLATGITLFGVDEKHQGVVLFIPVTTMMEIPGVGLDRLALSVQYDGVELTRATIENELGIRVDTVISGTEDQLGSFFQAMGGATLTIPQRLSRRSSDGTVAVRFEKGEQYLNGPALVDYLAYVPEDGNELTTFGQQQYVWESVFKLLENPAVSDVVFTPGPVNLTLSGPGSLVESVFKQLAEESKSNNVRYLSLPVKQVSSVNGKDVFAMRRELVASLIDKSFEGSKPSHELKTILPLQVLNGVGSPGIGRDVSDALKSLPVRIVLTENASSFDHPITKIIVYSESGAMYKAASEVREALGAGEILYSSQPQSLVQMTIIVGQDFVDAQTKVSVEAPPVEGALAEPTPAASAPAQ